MVVHFDDLAHFFQGVAHGGADFVVRIARRGRQVAALDRDAVAIVALAAVDVGVAVPGSLLGEDLEHRAGHVRLELHGIEDEELRLRTGEHGVTDTGGLQVFLGTLGDGARVALVALHGGRLDHVADQDQGRLFGERVHHGAAVVRQQDHVGGFDALPAIDGGTIEHLAHFEEVIVGVACRHGDVVLTALRVGEAQVNPLRVVLLNQFKRLRHAVLQGVDVGDGGARYSVFLRAPGPPENLTRLQKQVACHASRTGARRGKCGFSVRRPRIGKGSCTKVVLSSVAVKHFGARRRLADFCSKLEQFPL
ncbi:hypothetical protein D3C85_726190 [compost metagenome]